MGRGNRNVNRFAQRKRDKKELAKNPQNNGAGAPDTRKHYEDIVKENAAFETYYKTQKIIPEEDWAIFMKTLRANLPTAFRITGSKSEANTMLDVVRSQYFAEILNNKLPVVEKENNGEEITESEAAKENEIEEEEIKPISLPWYPGGLAWQLRLSRTDIRRSPPLYRLHNFLVAETAAGGVSRQETVSMIPPVVLDVKPHHKVLDMCAAPGSKTAQLLEFLHSEEDQMPTGFVVANDVDNSRCYMLVHQAKRLNSPCSIITNHDAAHMPALTTTDENGVEQPLQFDRVLCDVPCSGDATLRKNPDIWLKWSPGNGNNLHGIQYRVARRGAELLAVGGRLVYSTCSFNPLENEAVVHRILVEAEGSLKLVDSTPLLPGLIHSKGMSHWLPASKDLQFYNNYEEVPERWQTVVRPQMFPPKPEDAHKYNLDRCIRILPHQQDTGGFFVAAFEKVSPLPWESKKESKTSPDDSQDSGEKAEPERKAAEPQRKKRRMGGYREDPFVFFSGETEDVFPSIKEFYKLSDELDATCLLTRCFHGKKKNVYLVSPAIKKLVQMNENRIKIINTGIKTFVRCDNKNMRCAFRLSQEGLESIFQYIGPTRSVSIPHDDLVMMLNHDNPTNPPDLSLFSQETQDRVKDLESGSCVLTHEDGELRMRLVGWRGVKSLRAYTTTPHTVHMLRLLRADISRFDVDKFKKAEEEAKANDDGDQVKEEADELLEPTDKLLEEKDSIEKNEKSDEPKTEVDQKSEKSEKMEIE